MLCPSNSGNWLKPSARSLSLFLLLAAVLLVSPAAQAIASPPLVNQDTAEKDETEQSKKEEGSEATKAAESSDDQTQDRAEDTGTQETAESDAKEESAKETSAEENEVEKTTTEKKDDPTAWLKDFKWRAVGPTATGGRVVDIAVDPSDVHHIYVASAAGGLWESKNNGTTWNCIFENEETISIGDVALDPNDPQTIWIGSGEANNQRSSLAGNGIYKTTDGGKTWKNMGLHDTQHIGRVLVHPEDSNTVYVAAIGHLYSFNDQRGVFKTTDGGETWEKTLFVDSKTGVIDIAMHPENPGVLLAASYQRLRKAWDFDGNGPGSGIYRSEDGGDNWQRIESNLPTGDIGRIGVTFFPGDSKIAYATVANQNRRQPKSEDGDDAAETDQEADSSEGGEDEEPEDPEDSDNNQEAVLSEIETGFGFSLQQKNDRWVISKIQQRSRVRQELKRNDVLVSLAGISQWDAESLKAFLDSTQAGDRVSLQFRRGDAVEPITVSLQVPPPTELPEVGGQVYRSDDAGLTWTLVNSRPVGGQPPYYYGQIRVDPQDADRIYMLGVPVYVSTDGGKTFKSDGAPSVHVDHHALWINPENPNHIMLGNDGGFHISYDQAKTWDYVFNIPLAQFYAITADNQVPYHVYGGLQDNGSWGGPSEASQGVSREEWYRIGGGDGFYVQVDPNDHNIIFSESQFGVLGRQNRATGERAFIRPPQTDADDPDRVADRYNWNSPILMSQHDPRTIYFGGNKLFMSYNRGDDWLTISPDLTTNDPGKTIGNVPHCTITTIAESPLNKDWLVVGTDDGKVQLTRDRGTTWEDVSDGFPIQPNRWWCSRVEFSHNDLKTVYVSFTGYREDDFRAFVFKSTDAGETWKSIVGNLPAENVNVIKQDPKAAETLYVGTEQGAFVSLDDGQHWHRLSGLPRVSVQDLLIHPRDRDLIVGTHGRGIYIMDEITPFQERSAWLKSNDKDNAHLYSVADWLQSRPVSVDSFAGDRKLVAENPANGVAIWYELLEGVDLEKAKLVVKDAQGKEVATIKLADKPGLHKARFPAARGGRGGIFGRGRRGRNSGSGPGRYTVELTVGGETQKQSFEIVRP